jgi:hypothetical protein
MIANAMPSRRHKAPVFVSVHSFMELRQWKTQDSQMR